MVGYEIHHGVFRSVLFWTLASNPELQPAINDASRVLAIGIHHLYGDSSAHAQ